MMKGPTFYARNYRALRQAAAIKSYVNAGPYTAAETDAARAADQRAAAKRKAEAEKWIAEVRARKAKSK